MKIIDAHHHTWDRTVFPYSWMDDPHPVGDISDLKKNYLIEDLLEDAKDLDLINLFIYSAVEVRIALSRNLNGYNL